MHRIALIGANGQVGAELCLLLARMPDVTLIPVCRTRSGSAFLRAHGIAVRHGSCAVPAEARALLGDCDLVVNSALATGTPRQIRATEDAIIANALQQSAPGARVIHFSTMTVYGDPRPGRSIRWRTPYGRAKLATERTALRQARRAGKALFVLRLGHVGGLLQGISEQIRAALLADEVLLSARDVPSNLVYTVTIVDAMRKIAAGAVEPGIYDLMCVPQLSWRQVHEAECAIGGLGRVQLRQSTQSPGPASRGAGMRDAARSYLRAAARLLLGEGMRNGIASLLAHAPPRFNARAHAWWHLARARAEIAALAGAASPPEHLSWVANGTRFIEGLVPTRDLLAQSPYSDLLVTGRSPWPADLPAAAVQAPVSEARLLSTAT